jgi:hypothetical protein
MRKRTPLLVDSPKTVRQGAGRDGGSETSIVEEDQMKVPSATTKRDLHNGIQEGRKRSATESCIARTPKTWAALVLESKS